MNKRLQLGFFIFLLLVGTSYPAFIYSQTIDFNALTAADDFRWGVRSYHDGRFNEAVRAFERSLTGSAETPLIREWLGNAYYRSGMTDTALSLWRDLDDSDSAGAVLKNRLDILSGRAGLGLELAPPPQFVKAATISGKTQDYTLFSRPGSIYPSPDGGCYMTAFAGNEVLRFNANGALKQRLRGGVDGFNHPFDVYLAENGLLYVSEYEGDLIARCSPDGTGIVRFGGTGRGDGELVGPQFITGDGKGFLYVSDLGNRRICKFDLEGRFILSFGRRSGNFAGLREPSGIAVWNDRIFVADSRQKVIFEFDDSGNFITSHGDGLFTSPEGLFAAGEGTFLVADGERIVTYTLRNEKVDILSEGISGTGYYIKAVFDGNGNILASDINANRIIILSELTNLYSGLYVQVDRIDSSDFPEVLVDVTVQDRMGRPFSGLELVNFALTENGYPVRNIEYAGSGRTGPGDVSILLSGSAALGARKGDIRTALSEILSGCPPETRTRLIHTDGNPRVIYYGGEGGDVLRSRLDSAAFSDSWKFDLGLRMAASEIVTGRGRKGVVFLTDGILPRDSFDTYAMIDLLGYLRNNGIVFYAVILDNSGPIDPDLLYLAEQTGGFCWHLYRPAGVEGIVPHLYAQKTGNYTLRYQSAGEGGFGKIYIPIEIQAYYYTRSGRDRSGYFAPIEF